MATTRAVDLRAGVRAEVFTVAWMVIEAAVAIGAGIAARSILLTAFGVDSVIELFSGSILLWRLRLEASGSEVEEAERAERKATLFVAITLVLLCLYVTAASVYGLVKQQKPEASIVGIVLSLLAVIVMPWLGVTKRKIAARLHSKGTPPRASHAATWPLRSL